MLLSQMVTTAVLYAYLIHTHYVLLEMEVGSHLLQLVNGA